MIARARPCAQYTPQKRARVLPPELRSSAKASAVRSRRFPREEIQRESRIGEARRAGMVYGVKPMRLRRRGFIYVDKRKCILFPRSSSSFFFSFARGEAGGEG